MKYEEEFNAGKAAIAKASKILMKYYSGKPLSKRNKGEHDMVTEADLAAEKAMMDIIKKYFPRHNILSEECGEINNGGGARWIIDPLDGTHNFYFGLPLWGTMLAFEASGRVEFSIIALPVFEELYTAIKGGGSTLNGKKISVSDRKEKFLASFSLKDHNDPVIRKKFDLFADKFHRKFRSFGCIGLSGCLIATGRMNIQVATKTSPWDIAPVALLVEEAGGKVTDFSGNPWKPALGSYLMSNGKIHQQILDVISG
ncbi:MAG TPA: inositol monophosphatase [archaeon]|nr:inositol monophosphatase [archaeon]